MEKMRKTDEKKRARLVRPACAGLLAALALMAAACSGEREPGASAESGTNREETPTSEAAPEETSETWTEGFSENAVGSSESEGSAENAKAGETAGSPETPAASDPSEEIPDLAGLKEQNEDIYAWISIPGTGLSFPILQSGEDETFYLTHDENGEPDDGGCIYTEYFNRKDFSDPNTVIYGRNVEGRFGGLHQYQDRDFFDAHRTVEIRLEDRTLTYEIFAAYEFDDRHLIKIYDFWDKDIFASYLETVFSQRAMDAYIDGSVSVTEEDKIITLSTGVTGKEDRRYLVQAVLISG